VDVSPFDSASNGRRRCARLLLSMVMNRLMAYRPTAVQRRRGRSDFYDDDESTGRGIQECSVVGGNFCRIKEPRVYVEMQRRTTSLRQSTHVAGLISSVAAFAPRDHQRVVVLIVMPDDH
jgi:hypothetical protein